MEESVKSMASKINGQEGGGHFSTPSNTEEAKPMQESEKPIQILKKEIEKMRPPKEMVKILGSAKVYDECIKDVLKVLKKNG